MKFCYNCLTKEIEDTAHVINGTQYYELDDEVKFITQRKGLTGELIVLFWKSEKAFKQVNWSNDIYGVGDYDLIEYCEKYNVTYVDVKSFCAMKKDDFFKSCTIDEAISHVLNGGHAEFKIGDDGWYVLNLDRRLADLKEGTEFKLKSKTVMIGDMEIKAPSTKPLKTGDKYYIPDLLQDAGYYGITWKDTEEDVNLFKNGMVHVDLDSAINHTKALINLTSIKEAK